MPVTPDSYEAAAVAFGIAMLANSATFQALLGVGTAALAKAKIIESWGGTAGLTGGKGRATATDNTQFALAPPYAIVHQATMDPELIGIAVYEYTGTIAIELHLPRRTGSDTPPETFRRGRNTMGLIAAEIRAQFGAAGCLATGTCRSEGPSMPEQSGAEGDEQIADLFIEWTA